MFKLFSKQKLKSFLKTLVVVAIATVVVVGIIRAGVLDPSSSPADTMYSLDDIYYELNKSASATSSWGLDSSAAPTSTMYTLEEIYNITPKFHSSPGDATISDVRNSKTFYTDSASKLTGNVANCTLGASSCYASGGYWYDTSGTVTNNNLIRASYVAFSDGIKYTGNIANCTLGASSCYASGGYWYDTSGTVSSNTWIRSGYVAFSDGTKYTGTASLAGDANVKSGVTNAWDGAGTLSPAGTAVAGDCRSTKTFYSGSSWTQKTGNVANCTLGASSCYASGGYWYDTSGTVTNNNLIRASYVAFSDGIKYTGNIANCSDGGTSCYASGGVWASDGNCNSQGDQSCRAAGSYYGATTCSGTVGQKTCYAGASGEWHDNECGNSTTGTLSECYVDDTVKYVTNDLCNADNEKRCYVTDTGWYYGTGGTVSSAAWIRSGYAAYSDGVKYTGTASLAGDGNVKSGVNNAWDGAGTLAPGGTAVAGDCRSTKTFYSGSSWTQKTGNVANCTLGASSCYASGGYWYDTSGTLSSASYLKSGLIAFSDGTKYTGTASLAGDANVKSGVSNAWDGAGTLDILLPPGDSTVCFPTCFSGVRTNKCDAGEDCDKVCADWGLSCISTLIWGSEPVCPSGQLMECSYACDGYCDVGDGGACRCK